MSEEHDNSRAACNGAPTLSVYMGCEHAQGYGIARPMPAEQFLPWLAQRRAAGRASVVALVPSETRAG